MQFFLDLKFVQYFPTPVSIWYTLAASFPNPGVQHRIVLELQTMNLKTCESSCGLHSRL